VYWLSLHTFCAISPNHYTGCTAVCNETAITACQRITHHAPVEHIFAGERTSGEGIGIQIGPLSRSHRNISQHLARGAELVHMTWGGKSIRCNRMTRLIGFLMPQRPTQSHEPPTRPPLVGAIA